MEELMLQKSIVSLLLLFVFAFTAGAQDSGKIEEILKDSEVVVGPTPPSE